MKKLVSLAVSLCMMLSLCVPAFAAGTGYENFKAGNTYSAGIFRDVSAEAWYADSVKTCYEYGLMKGAGPEKFNPKGDMTVAEAIVMADRVHEIFNTGKSTLKNGSLWYQTYVDYALQNGIILPEETWDYTAKITRAEMAGLFFRSVSFKEEEVRNYNWAQPDLPIMLEKPMESQKFAEEIYTLYDLGILTGSDIYGTFHPDANISRAEAATIIARVALPVQRKDVTLLLPMTLSHGITLNVPENMGFQREETENSEFIIGIESDLPEQISINMTTDQYYPNDYLTQIPLEMYEETVLKPQLPGYAISTINIRLGDSYGYHSLCFGIENDMLNWKFISTFPANGALVACMITTPHIPAVFEIGSITDATLQVDGEMITPIKDTN